MISIYSLLINLLIDSSPSSHNYFLLIKCSKQNYYYDNAVIKDLVFFFDKLKIFEMEFDKKINSFLFTIEQ